MKKKKESIFKPLKNWFSLLWLGYKTEIQDRVFMSWKRLIKFLGISIVPIIYGVVCLVAFWNPITGIGHAPIAILNQDQNIILVKTLDPNNFANDEGVYKVGALVNPNYDQHGANDWKNEDATIYQNVDDEQVNDNSIVNLHKIIADGLTEGQTYYLNNGLSFVYDKTTTNLSAVSLWEVMKSMMLPKTDETIKDEDYTFKTGVIAQGMALTNIHYISDADTINKQWHGSKYYIQIKLEKNYTANLFGWLGSVLNTKKDEASFADIRAPSDWKDLLSKMQIWTTYERNFIFGYYMQTFSTFASGMIFKAVPDAFTKLVMGDLVSGLSTYGSILNRANGADIPNDNENDHVSPNKEYVLLRSEDTIITPPINGESLKPYSIFGKVNQEGQATPMKEAGGKFIRSLEETKAIERLGIIEILESIFGPISSGVKIILNEIFKDLDKIKDIENLNAFIYRGVTGQWTEADFNPSGNSDIDTVHEVTFNFLKILGFNVDDHNDLIDKVTIFTKNEVQNPLMTREFFENKFGDFMVKNTNVFGGAKNLKELPSIIAAKRVAHLTGGIGSNDLVGFKLQGSENGLYGIGLGEFFLVIGIWIGVLMQTFVFDRAKRVAKLTPSTWYLSKTLLMLTVALIQATLVVWAAYLAGWHMIGIEATLFMWLWLMAANIMFVIIIQGLWFALKDETIGKFLAVIVMVLSLAAGGGTFPAIAQFKFFTIIGYVVPFTYVLKGLGAIVFGVSILGTTANTTAVILQSFAAFFAYIVVFGSLGLFVGAKNRFKEMNYGSHYGRCVALAMVALKRDPDEIGFRTIKKTSKTGKNHYRYDWKKLPPGFDWELYLKCREMFPFEGRFKWWERKHHDFVQRPNFSDEDIMTRNE